MAAPVLILDSRAKADTLLEQYGGDLEPLLVLSLPVKATFRPPPDRLQKGLAFDFSPLPAEAAFIEKLQQSIGRDIYLALDSDPRGECWCWLISEYVSTLSQGATVPMRLHLAGLNREDLHESLKLVAPVENDKATRFWIRSLFHSYLARHFQRLLGTINGPGNLPLTYQTLTILLLLAERENEVRSYTPALKWQVKVRLDGGGGEFLARLEEVFGITDDGYVRDSSQGKEVVKVFRDLHFAVESLSRSALAVTPPAPFSVLEILQEAHILHGIGPRKVLDGLRKLYYGVEFGGTRIGLLSSYVTREGAVAKSMVERIRQQVTAEYGEKTLAADGENPVGWEALLPLKPGIRAADLGEALTEEEALLYDMVRNRALASQMAGAKGNVVEVTLKAGDKCTFRSTMREVTTPGFLVAYHSSQERDLVKPCPLSLLQEGSRAEVIQIIPEQTTEFPPEFYSYESLFVDLADFAVGPDVISIGIIQNLLDKGYLFLTADGSIRCKENTMKVVATLNRAFPSMTGMNFTAYIEQTIEEAVSLRKPLDIALRQFDQTLFMHGRVLVKYTAPAAPKKARPAAPAGPAGAVRKAVPAAGAGEERHARREQAEVSQPAPEEAPGLETEAPIAPPMAEEPAETVNVAEEAGAAVTPAPEAVEATPVAETGEEARAAESGPESLELPPAIELGGDAGLAADVLEVAAVEQAVAPEEASQAIFDAAPEEARAEEAPPPPPLPPIAEAVAVGGPTKPCPECHRNMVVKSDRYGKYWTCTGFPACRHAESFERGEEGVMPCPLCGEGTIQMKRTPAGKLYYVCLEKSCEFMAWSRPHPIPCQVCSSPFLVEKQDLSGRQFLRCPRAGCSYMQPMPGEEAFEPVEEDAGEGMEPEEAAPAAGSAAPGAGVAAAAPVKKKIVVRRVAPGAAPAAGAGGKKRVVRVVRKK